MSLMSLAATVLAESDIVEGEDKVPLPPYVYGGLAFVVLLLLLVVVTRLDLDR
jgi:hypothetical protein